MGVLAAVSPQNYYPMRYFVFHYALLFAPVAMAGEPVKLVEKAKPDSEFRVISSSSIDGYLLAPVATDKPPERINVRGKSTIDYAERILKADPREADHKTLRVYEKIEFRKTAGDRTDEMTLRPAVRALVMMKRGDKKLPFSPDGPLMWGELDLVRRDFMVSALAGLLPDRAVRPGETWTASRGSAVELTDMEEIESGELTCKLERVTANGARTTAEVTFSGTLAGVDEDGRSRHKLTGKLLVDLTAECICFLKVDGEHYKLDEAGKDAGKITGTFAMTRERVSGNKRLAEAAAKPVDPSEENTRLLYDSDEAGIAFIHPRQWHVKRIQGRQIIVDGPRGAGLLITLDTAEKVPAAGAYMLEARKDLERRGAQVTGRRGPDRVAEGVDTFTLEVDFGKESVTMAYFVIRQDRGGATFAARVPAADREARLKELERIARSFAVTRRLDGK
jgi:hypothetical protein